VAFYAIRVKNSRLFLRAHKMNKWHMENFYTHHFTSYASLTSFFPFYGLWLLPSSLDTQFLASKFSEQDQDFSAKIFSSVRMILLFFSLQSILPSQGGLLSVLFLEYQLHSPINILFTWLLSVGFSSLTLITM
jgi:hypothetical protein